MNQEDIDRMNAFFETHSYDKLPEGIEDPTDDDDEDDDAQHAAGIMFITPRGQVLFIKRAASSDHPGEWAFPGGGIEAGETPEQAAVREAHEEVGSVPDGERELLDERDNGHGVRFTTYRHQLKGLFEPKLNGEHTEYRWALPSDPPQPLHPGVALTIQHMNKEP